MKRHVTKFGMKVSYGTSNQSGNIQLGEPKIRGMTA